jgi:predicted flap endonuclease-1-like 5' DNA nuclease
MRSEITTGVQSALEQQGKKLFVSQDSFTSEIAAINKRVDGNRTLNTNDINAALSGLPQQFISSDVFESRINEQQVQFDTTVQERVNEQVEGQIGSKISTSLEEVNSRLDGLDLAENRINTSTGNQLDSLRQDFSKISQQAIATEIQGLQINLRSVQDQVSSINTRMTSITNEAVSSALLTFKQGLQSDLKLVQQNITRIDKQLVEFNPAKLVIAGNLRQPAQPVISDNRPVILRSEAPAQPAATSDFTELNGIGAVYANRLAANNIHNFSDLSPLSSAQLASILKISETRVNSLQLQKKAAARLKV